MAAVFLVPPYVLGFVPMRSLALVLLALSTVTVPAAILWDQPPLANSTAAFRDQELPLEPSYSSYIVSDFECGPPTWFVDTVTTYFVARMPAAGNWRTITAARLNVFPQTSSLPDPNDNPQLGRIVPVTVSLMPGGMYKITAEDVDLLLYPGRYWLGLTPIVSSNLHGSQFHARASAILDDSALRNPGGGGGFGTTWRPAGTQCVPPAHPWDAAFRLEGTIVAPEPSILCLALVAVCVRLKTRR